MFTVDQSVQILAKKIKKFPELLFILGSGWNALAGEVKVEQEILYSDLFDVQTSVPGHAGKLIIGTIDKKSVALMVGRFHTYEGYTTEESTRPLQVFARLGLKRVVVTAAVGALNEKFAVGDFVILSDMITMFCLSPLIGPSFVDLSSVFDTEMRLKAFKVANRESIAVHEGVYVYTRGPHFETPADKMMLRQLGADVVGMSTVPEAIMAKSLALKVLGVSYVTNLAFVKHDHKDVLAAANKGSGEMIKVLKGVLL